MRWKEMLIGALMALFVTVIGGLLVYFVTLEEPVERKEALRFDIEDPVSFEGKDNRVSIGYLRFSNVGDLPASGVRAVLEFGANEVLEYYVRAENKPQVSHQLDREEGRLEVQVDALLPGDVVAITYLTKSEVEPSVVVRSQNSSAEQGPVTGTVVYEEPNRSFVERYINALLPILGLLFMIFVVLARKIAAGRRECRNNNGFVLLHSGQFEDACRILRDAVGEGEDGSHALANYALSLYLAGDVQRSDGYLRASKMLAVGKHAKAVIAFNEAIILAKMGSWKESIGALETAISGSAREIRDYCRDSVLVEELIQQNSLWKEALKESTA